VIQAHPFRMRGYMDRIRLGSDFADGIEVANAGNEALDDARAWRYGKEKDLVMTAGSDNHRSPADVLYGVRLEKRLTSIYDYVKIILDRNKIGLYVPEGRFELAGVPEIDERHKAYLLDDSGRDIRAPKEWID
jgi:hypothetical protein